MDINPKQATTMSFAAAAVVAALVGVLVKGKVVLESTSKALLARDNLSDLYFEAEAPAS